MSVRLVHRPARVTPSLTLPEDVVLREPAALPDGEQGGMGALALIPMLGSAGAMSLMMFMRNSAFAAFGAILMIVMLIGGVVMFVSNRGKNERQRKNQRDRYLNYLERTRRELRAAEDEYRASAGTTYPTPGDLVGLIHDDARLWERRRAHSDFLSVRVGTGTRPIRTVTIRPSDNPTEISDDFMLAEARLVAKRFETAPDVPVVVGFDRAGHVSVVGAGGDRLARAVLAGAAALNSPEDLLIGIMAPAERQAEWEWAQWLPHASLGVRAGGALRIAPTMEGFRALVHRELESRTSLAAEAARSMSSANIAGSVSRMLLVVDARDGAEGYLESPDPRFSLAQLGVTVLHLVRDRLREPDSVRMRFTETDADQWVLERYQDEEITPERVAFTADPFSPPEAEALGRALSPLRLSEESLEHSEERSVTAFTEMMGIGDIHNVQFDRIWNRHTESSFLRVPIGVDDGGGQVVLDLKESAQFGMGPHGLCVGATGSGKSELLRTLVLGLLATHSPEDLSMVLVDYKGGATFAPFVNAPQVAGLITNLSDDVSLVDRVYTSLEGEILRRQELLKSAGNINDVTMYRQRRAEVLAEGGEMQPLPHLMVIIDEFGELLTARPDFIDLFLQIGRIGRSIGVHLLLSSQRIEGGKLRGLDTYLSYRLGLRTLSEGESRSVLETSDAFTLPPLPGYGYLKVDTTVYTRFRAGYVSGELPDETEAVQEEVWNPRIGASTMFSVRYPDQRPEEDESPAPTRAKRSSSAPTVLSTILDQLQLRPRAVSPIWLDPMPDVMTLDQISGPPHETPQGLRLTASAPLRLPIGLVDNPARQDQGSWEVDLTNGGGNHLIVGGPQSGKSTLLQTMAASASLTHTPEELGVYAIDLLGSGLLAIQDLPNVGGVAVRTSMEAIRRTVEEIIVMMDEREVAFERLGIDSMSTLRRRRAEGELPDIGSTDVILLIDGWGQLREDFEFLEDPLRSIVTRGPAFGVHTIATAGRMMDVRMQAQSSFVNRIELRLSDPGDSAIDRKLAEQVPQNRPGRALVDSELFAHAALPRIDGVADAGDLSAGTRDLVAQVSTLTEGRARKVRLLPRVVTVRDLAPAPGNPLLIPVGLAESTVEPFYFDLEDRDRDVIILGDSETGKTTILRHLVESLIARHPSEEINLAILDPRRTLRDVFPEDYVGGYASSVAVASGLMKAMRPDLESRVPRTTESQGDDGLAGKPRVVLVVDDYDILTGAGVNPLGDLRTFIAMGSQIKFQTLVARRMSGASRAMYESGFSTLKDSGATGIMLSGDRMEGALLGGIRPQRFPVGRGMVIQTGRPPQTVQFALPDGVE
ncbi:MAG: type VII secretion protein EccCa [bacterium]|nr:type VII secretion protein EccCa [bacterium]